MFLKIYNYFVRGLVLFLLICIPYSLVTNPELVEDEVDFYFFVIAYVLILLFYVPAVRIMPASLPKFPSVPTHFLLPVR